MTPYAHLLPGVDADAGKVYRNVLYGDDAGELDAPASPPDIG